MNATGRMLGLVLATAMLGARCATEASHGNAERPVPAAENPRASMDALRFSATTVEG